MKKADIINIINDILIKKNKNITIIVSIIYLIIFICNIYYLHNLKNCLCFKQLNIDKKINLNNLLAINYIFLFILIIKSIYIINISTTQKGGSFISISITAITFIVLILFMFMYAYYIDNIYEIYKKDSTSKNCDCLESKFKYSLYIHAIILFVTIVFSIIKPMS